MACETIGDANADPDVAAASVAIVAAAGDADTFDEYVAAHSVLADAPGAAAVPSSDRVVPDQGAHVARARLAMSDAVRAQNGPFLLQRALRNREHGPLVWAFVRDHWDDVRARFRDRWFRGCSRESPGWSTTRRWPTSPRSSPSILFPRAPW